MSNVAGKLLTSRPIQGTLSAMRTTSSIKIKIHRSLAFWLAFWLGSSSYAGPQQPPSAEKSPALKTDAAKGANKTKKDVTMTASKKCKPDNLHRSKCMIELMLNDIAASYGATGGGGISNIKALTSTSYSVSLPQEERIDVLTYEFKVASDGTVSIAGKVPSTSNPRQ